MYRVERTRREYCSFPTVIKSYDSGDSGAVVQAGRRKAEPGWWQRGAVGLLPSCSAPCAPSPAVRCSTEGSRLFVTYFLPSGFSLGREPRQRGAQQMAAYGASPAALLQKRGRKQRCVP